MSYTWFLWKFWYKEQYCSYCRTYQNKFFFIFYFVAKEKNWWLCWWNRSVLNLCKYGPSRVYYLKGFENKSQYWPRGAPRHGETVENEKALRTYGRMDRRTDGRTDGRTDRQTLLKRCFGAPKNPRPQVQKQGRIHGRISPLKEGPSVCPSIRPSMGPSVRPSVGP